MLIKFIYNWLEDLDDVNIIVFIFVEYEVN